MKHLISFLIFCTATAPVYAGEDSGGGGRSAKKKFESMNPSEAWAYSGFRKNIPSIKMPGTKSYFKATSLCVSGSKIKTKKIMAEACTMWIYSKESKEVTTQNAIEATRNDAKCISYKASILSHPIDYSIEKTIKGVKDSAGNIRFLNERENRFLEGDLVEEKRLLSQSMSKVIRVEFYAAASKKNKFSNSETYLGFHKYNLEKCKTIKRN